MNRGDTPAPLDDVLSWLEERVVFAIGSGDGLTNSADHMDVVAQVSPGTLLLLTTKAIQ